MGLRILFFYSILILIVNILSYKNQESTFLYVLFTLIESVAFIGFLFLQINKKNVKRTLFIIGFVYLLFDLLYPVFNNGVMMIDSIQIGIETIIVLVFSFYFLYEKTNDTTTLYIYSTFSFWVVIGMVLYLAGSFFIYLFASSIGPEKVKPYWAVTNFLSFLKNIFFAIAILVNSKPTKKLSIPDYELSSLN